MIGVIFGSGGQDAYYMRHLLNNKGIEVVGVSRSAGNWLQGSVSDYELVSGVIKKYKPAFIFHFAANSTTQHGALWDNHASISTGSLNILEVCRIFSPESRIFLSGSGLQFVNNSSPIDESFPFSSTSPYVVARNQSVFAARYFRSLGLKVYVGYFFNHESPLRPGRHMAQRIVSYCRGADTNREKLEIGNLDVRKEWTFASDVVDAVWKLVNQDRVFEAVIGSGIAHSIEEWIRLCFEKVGKDWREYIIVKENFVPEYQILVSNPGLIKSLGWEPTIGIDKLADMMLSFK